jgi:hypothetical protein
MPPTKKLEARMTRQELVQHLKRQITFISNSAAAFDQGCAEEAIRIAVVIRVLCHDTSKSTSLFKLMGEKDTLQLVTTAGTLPPSVAAHPLPYGELLRGQRFGKTISYDPVPANAPTLACPDWWAQTIFISADEPYSRRDVVLASAHMDGGAHVAEPDSDLKALREGFWVKVTKDSNGGEIREPMGDTHFRMLRRFADELLNSPELLKLTA